MRDIKHKKVKVKRQGHYVRVYHNGDMVAGYNIKKHQMYGATKYWQYLFEWRKDNGNV